MSQDSNEGRRRPYDLEERSLEFAMRVRALMRRLSRTISNTEDGKQLIRASASVGANYIEANEALGKKDFRMHLKISRKEAEEPRFFLKLLQVGADPAIVKERELLVQEATEFIRIFSAMLRPHAD